MACSQAAVFLHFICNKLEPIAPVTVSSKLSTYKIPDFVKLDDSIYPACFKHCNKFIDIEPSILNIVEVPPQHDLKFIFSISIGIIKRARLRALLPFRLK